MSKYVFEGERIKLNAKDFARMKDLYSNLNLVRELEQLDFELRDKKKWWPEMNAKLNYRNRVNANATRQSSHRESLSERTYREAQEVFADVEAREAGERTMDQDDATVWPQVAQPSRTN